MIDIFYKKKKKHKRKRSTCTNNQQTNEKPNHSNQIHSYANAIDEFKLYRI